MFELPLHPLIVHFPIVLASLIPLLGIILLVGIRKSYFNPQSWVLIPLLAALYLGSSIVAIELGEEDAEKVEQIVDEDVIEEHEEVAEMLPWIAGGILLISLTPLALKYRTRLQILTVVVSALGLAPVVEAGHTGGLLVYKHSAANAHKGSVDSNEEAQESDSKMDEDSDEEEDHDHDHDHDHDNQFDDEQE